MSQSSLIVGINDYPAGNELYECVSDAVTLAEILRYNELGPDNHWPNFVGPNLFVSPSNDIDSSLIIDPKLKMTKQNLLNAITRLFSSDSHHILFYFSGHSEIDFRTGSGFLKTPDQMGPGDGVSFSEVMRLANEAAENGKVCVIILDSCKSGKLGESSKSKVSELATGVTVLAAARGNEAAIEEIGGGVFTRLLIEGLKGSAADIAGRITPASLYAYVDSSLGNMKQRPVFKTNVNRFMPLRQVVPRIPLNILRNLNELFEQEDTQIKLSPEHEPTPREDLPEKYHHTKPNPEKVEDYLKLRALNRQGLVVTVGVENLYDAAMESQACELTELGRFYFRLSKAKLI